VPSAAPPGLCPWGSPGGGGGLVNQPESLILHLLSSTGAPLTFEEIIGKLPELSWNQVFLGVDELSRRGAIILKRRGYSYEVSVDRGAFAQVG